MAKKSKVSEVNTSEEISLPDTVEIIDPNAIVNVKISSSFFNRLGIIYQRMIENKTKDELGIAYQQIEQKNVTEMWIQDLETMIILINEFQKNAKLEKQMKKISKTEYSKLLSEAIGIS